MTRGRWSFGRSMFWRLLIAVGTVVVLTLVLSAVALEGAFEQVFERQLVGVMLQDAQGVAHWAEPYMASGSVSDEDLQSNLDWLKNVTQGRLWLIDPQGTVVADTDLMGSFRGERLNHPLVSRVLAGETVTETNADPELGSAVAVGYPIVKNGQILGAAFLVVAPTNLSHIFTDLKIQVGLPLLAIVIAGLLAALTLSRLFSRPIEKMAHFAANLGQRQFAGDLPATGIREFDRLSMALEHAARELENAFDELVEEKQRIQALIQGMAEGVVAIDEYHRVLLINPAAGRLLGVPEVLAEQLVEKAGFPEPLVAALAQTADSQAAEEVSTHFSCGGAEIRAVVSPVPDAHQGASGAVAVLQDVTQEMALRRLRENFVANVSHELRGPLAALSAGVEAMHDGLITEASRPRYLAAMLAEMNRLSRLVNDLLELSRLDAGTAQIPLEEFSLRPLFEGLREKWRPRARSAGVHLKVECGELRVLSNRDRFEEILTNFLDNALRYTPPGGIVCLRAHSEGEMIRICVEDSGEGIPREHLANIWDRFYKVDAARTRTQGNGTGLGLSIVKQLVERLGGEVAVESEPGKGSCFSFTVVAANGPESVDQA